MANKSSTIIVRMEPDIKSRAEAIMNNLGLPVSVVINALYHQIIYTQSIPFSLTLPNRLPVEEDMSKEEFKTKMEESVGQAERGDTVPVDEAFKIINSNIKK